MNIAINGLGRIGRAVLKIIIDKVDNGENLNVVAINDLTEIENLAYLLKYDSVYGVYHKKVGYDNGSISIGDVKIKVLNQKEPNLLPWKDLNVDVVLECTGFFTNFEGSSKHLKAGAKKVVISAPSKDSEIPTCVLGTGELNLNKNIISNASCTTNSVAPIINLINNVFGIKKAMLTTAHAYTATQSLVDAPAKKDMRRGRAAANSIIPTTTGAAKATLKALPSLKEGIFDGVALRVPVICGSISDLTIVLDKKSTVDEVNNEISSAISKPGYKGIVTFTKDPIVSSDIIKSPFSAIVDGSMTRLVDGDLLKLMVWYDNEWGYSNRLVEVVEKFTSYDK